MNKMAILGAIIVVAIVVIAGAYLYTSMAASPQQNVTTTAATTTVSVSTNPTTTTPVTTVAATTTVANSTLTNSSNTAYTINVEYKAAVNGNYLVNATGWTLYLYTADTQYSNMSVCYGECATFWPPFYTANLTIPSSLNASNFGVITRTGGAKQLTYMGWPLYYYAGDQAAGDTNGQGSGGNWFVVNVPKIILSS